MVNYSGWKIAVVLVVCLLGLVYAAPNLLDRETTESWADATPDYFPGQQINLGLDLQGGSHLLLDVDMATVIEDRLEDLTGSVRDVLREAEVGYQNLGVQDDAVGFTLRDPGAADRVRQALRGLAADVTIDQDGPEFRVALTDSATAQRRRQALQQAIEVVRRRIDELGVREPVVQAQGTERIVVQLPGVDDPQRVREILGQTARLTFHLVDEDTSLAEARQGELPPGSRIMPAMDPGAGDPEAYVIRRRAALTGERLSNASTTFQDGQPAVRFQFDSAGARIFGDLTRENVNSRFAIVLDGEVVSAPVINEPIPGGTGVITGNFTTQEAQDLALVLRSGALPAPLEVIQQRTVGPGLGEDSIEAGQIAVTVGLVSVVVFMVLIYGRFGVYADVALGVNLVLLVAVLSALQATLTLPGIAGIVLTVGMAVDANVLIFERLREEERHGRTPIAAVDAGYRSALTTIIDANVTTLIAAGLLFYFGSGPIRGFAITLSIGILTSMFSAIMVTRLLVVLWLRRRRPNELAV